MLNDPVDGWLNSSVVIGSAEAEVASTHLSLVLGPVVINYNRDGTNSSWNFCVLHTGPTHHLLLGHNLLAIGLVHLRGFGLHAIQAVFSVACSTVEPLFHVFLFTVIAITIFVDMVLCSIILLLTHTHTALETSIFNCARLYSSSCLIVIPFVEQNPFTFTVERTEGCSPSS